ncbi:MAG: FKBP-type peptidyl-prolyl cis-trans isomerase [Candidatus Micrarchaeia archaeon]
MPFKDGDFLEVDYTIWDAADNSVISTTDENTAKSSNIYDEHARYKPVLIVLGKPENIKGLDRMLRDMNIGEEKTATFKPSEAFGERDESLVRVVPMANFKANNIKPYPGMPIDIEDMHAVVKSVSAGRVVVDANPPLAGHELTYKVKIIKQLVSNDEKIKAITSEYGVEPSSINDLGNSIKISYNSEVSKNNAYFSGKVSAISYAFALMPEIEKIVVEEEFSNPNKKEAKEEKAK